MTLIDNLPQEILYRISQFGQVCPGLSVGYLIQELKNISPQFIRVDRLTLLEYIRGMIREDHIIEAMQYFKRRMDERYHAISFKYCLDLAMKDSDRSYEYVLMKTDTRGKTRIAEIPSDDVSEFMQDEYSYIMNKRDIYKESCRAYIATIASPQMYLDIPLSFYVNNYKTGMSEIFLDYPFVPYPEVARMLLDIFTGQEDDTDRIILRNLENPNAIDLSVLDEYATWDEFVTTLLRINPMCNIGRIINEIECRSNVIHRQQLQDTLGGLYDSRIYWIQYSGSSMRMSVTIVHHHSVTAEDIHNVMRRFITLDLYDIHNSDSSYVHVVKISLTSGDRETIHKLCNLTM